MLGAAIFVVAGATALSAYGECGIAERAAGFDCRWWRARQPCLPTVSSSLLHRLKCAGPGGSSIGSCGSSGSRMRPVTDAVAHLLSCSARVSLHGSLTAGINIGPLMASVGGIGLAVGLATQNLAANVVSALAL